MMTASPTEQKKNERLRVGMCKFSQHWVLKGHSLQTCSHMSIHHVHIGMLTFELFTLAWQLLNGKLSKLLLPIKMIVKNRTQGTGSALSRGFGWEMKRNENWF